METGEEVMIAGNGKPAVKLVVVAPPVGKSRKQMLGSGIGKIWRGTMRTSRLERV